MSEKLKKAVKDELSKALNLQVASLRESVEAKDVASAFVKAMEKIDKICSERNRY